MKSKANAIYKDMICMAEINDKDGIRRTADTLSRYTRNEISHKAYDAIDSAHGMKEKGYLTNEGYDRIYSLNKMIYDNM